MVNVKAVFLDRDGVLNRNSGRSRYVRDWSEFVWIPGAIKAVAQLKQAGYTIILISNQAGVGSGQMKTEDLAEIEHHMQEDLQRAGGAIDAAYYCLHRPDAGCECRKPKPGLLHQAQKDFALSFPETCFIGDDLKDLQAGAVVGCPTYIVSESMSILDIVEKHILRKKPA